MKMEQAWAMKPLSTLTADEAAAALELLAGRPEEDIALEKALRSQLARTLDRERRRIALSVQEVVNRPDAPANTAAAPANRTDAPASSPVAPVNRRLPPLPQRTSPTRMRASHSWAS